MTFEEAIRQAMRAYWKGDAYDKSQSFKDKKYNKKYFDAMKQEIKGNSEEPEMKSKKKAKY